MKRWTRVWYRSVQVQLGLLIGTFAGGLVLAIAAIVMREWFFEKYVREKYDPAIYANTVPEKLRTQVESIARGTDRSPLEMPDSPASFAAIYGRWLNEPATDPDSHVRDALAVADADLVIPAIRRTLTVGSTEQKLRSLDLLSRVPTGKASVAVRKLIELQHQRCIRRGEAELAERMTSILDRHPPVVSFNATIATDLALRYDRTASAYG